MRSEPPVSDPSAKTADPLATATAEPDDDPPVMNSKFHGILRRAVHGIVARGLISELGHRGEADAACAGAVELVKYRCLRRSRQGQWLSKPAMRQAGRRNKHVLGRIRHRVKDAARVDGSAFEFDKRFQPRLKLARKFARVRRKLCTLRRIKLYPISKTHRHDLEVRIFGNAELAAGGSKFCIHNATQTK